MEEPCSARRKDSTIHWAIASIASITKNSPPFGVKGIQASKKSMSQSDYINVFHEGPMRTTTKNHVGQPHGLDLPTSSVGTPSFTAANPIMRSKLIKIQLLIYIAASRENHNFEEE
jgi:hypothetical protein